MNAVMNPNVVSAVFALFAAVLWLLSALVKTPAVFQLRAVQSDEYIENSIRGVNPAHAVGTVQSDDLPRLAAALQRQSRLSAAAALCACVSAIAQAIAVW
jgi:hypothetical protein